jgi:hypothetical protein
VVKPWSNIFTPALHQVLTLFLVTNLLCVCCLVPVMLGLWDSPLGRRDIAIDTGQTLVKHWSNTGQALVKHWRRPRHAGPLGLSPRQARRRCRHWSNAGQKLVKCWSNSGQCSGQTDLSLTHSPPPPSTLTLSESLYPHTHKPPTPALPAQASGARLVKQWSTVAKSLALGLM